LQRENIGLVGIGAMTRMVARAYKVADALRDAGIKVVMGGPHVTECPTKRSDATAENATPTRLRSAKPTKPGL
jgi:predicted nicotinamide N-methyase